MDAQKTWANWRAIERSVKLIVSPLVQSALPAKRDGPRARQIRARKSKQIQINPRKIAWISLRISLVESGLFNGLRRIQIKKLFSCHTVSQMPQKPKARMGREFPLATTAFDDQSAFWSTSKRWPLQHLSKLSGYAGRPKTSRKYFVFSNIRRGSYALAWVPSRSE